MTIASNDRRKTYDGNGVTTVFNGPRAFSASHIQVSLIDDDTGVKTAQTGGDYTLTGVGRAATVVTMNVAPPVGKTLLILRTVPYTQDTDIKNQGAFLPEIHEDAFDFQVMQTQQLADGVERSFRLPEHITDVNTELPVPDALSPLVWNADGDGLENGSTTLTGDMLLRPNLADDDVGSLLVAFKQQGTGAVGRTVLEKLRERVSVLDYIPVEEHAAIKGGTSTYDCTTGINAAIAANPGFCIYFPGGKYRYAGGGDLSAAGTAVQGDGRAVVWATTASAAYLFRCSGSGSAVRGLTINAEVAQTSGSFVILSGFDAVCEDCVIANDANGILMTGVGARIRKVRMPSTNVAGAVRIDVSGGDTSQVIDQCLIGANTPANGPANGIRITHSSALIISNTSVISNGTGLYVHSLGASDRIFSLYVHHCFFDNCTRAVDVSADNGGTVQRIRFDNCWFGSSTNDGLRTTTAGTGTVNGIDIAECQAVNNGGSGISLSGSTSNINIRGGLYAANAWGVFQNAAVANMTVIGATLGAGSGFGGNTNRGLSLFAGSTNNIVVGNNITGNTVAAVTNGAGSSVLFDNNQGYLTRSRGGQTTTTDANGDVVFAHGLAGTPTSVIGTAAGTSGYLCTFKTADATNITLNFRNPASSNAVVASGSVTYRYMAEL